MDLETRLVCVHGDAAGLHARGRREEGSVRRPGPEGPTWRRCVAYVTAESRGMKMNVAARPSEGAGGLRARREDLLLPRRPARLRLRHLPRRGRQAHPAAGPAEPHQDGRRADAPTRRGRRTACRRASCARSSGASTTASASSASRSSSSPRDASVALTMFLAQQRQRRRVRRARRSSADGDDAMNDEHDRSRSPSRRRSSLAGCADDAPSDDARCAPRRSR